MSKQTAMQQMYDELIANEYIIPIDLIVKCRELIKMEREQIEEAFKHGQNNGFMYHERGFDTISSNQFYKQIYGGQDEK